MKNIIKKFVRKLGFDLRKFSPETSEAARLQQLFHHHQFDLVLDVGANIGEYAQMLRDLGYAGKIVSFEPLSSAYAKLQLASGRDSQWEIASRAAVGSNDGEITINIANNSYSSSALEMLDSHVKASPDSYYIGSEVVPLRKLDTIARDYVAHSNAAFLKIDVQGLEMQVLEGSRQILNKIMAVQMELSLTPLYKGETLFKDMIGTMEAFGYDLYNISAGCADPQTGRLLQVDAIFVKKGRG